MTACQVAGEFSGEENYIITDNTFLINTLNFVSRNNVCVWSILDLPTILQSGKFIINKVMTNYDPVIGECLRDSVKKREISQQTRSVI